MNIESNDIIDIATAYREAGLHLRDAEPLDDVWISAINESASTLVGRPQYRERIEQAYERLESRQFTTGLPKILRPTSSVTCEPACRAPLCMATREWLKEFGITEFTCSGCHVCVSFQRGRGA